MSAATITLQLTLWSALLAALLVATADRRARARRARARRRSGRVHLGAGEHPIGSVATCPGCATWRSSSRTQRRARARRRWLRNGRRWRDGSTLPTREVVRHG